MTPGARRPVVALRRLAESLLEAPDIEALRRLLTEELPAAAGVSSTRLLFWDRRLASFETPTPPKTQDSGPRSGEMERPAESDARYLISDGQLLETRGTGDGALLPLMARSGLVGMLFLGSRPGRRKAPYRPAELRELSILAKRAALAVENHLYQHEIVASERLAALGTMASMLAHDFRGPMTVIRGYAETLLEEAGLPQPEVRERAELIIRMIDRLEQMTVETLDFARAGARLARRRVTLSSFLVELADGVSLELPGLTIVRDFRVPAATVASLDVDKLRRAVGNIASNSRDAMGGQGRCLLQAELEDGRLVLTVADEGPGVPAEIRDRLFDPFVTHGKRTGTGLGLAVARRFVEDHGGTLELLPEGPGARFRLSLPIVEG